MRRKTTPNIGLALAVVAAILAGGLVTASPATAAPPTLPNPNSHGITLQSWEQVTPSEPDTVPRLIDATMTTASIFEARGTPSIDPVTIPFNVRIYVPANYDATRAQPYPALYLLHGGAGTFSDWSDTSMGDLKSTLAGVFGSTGFDGIVVMPEGGRAGWYTDWYGATDGDFAPLWESFHVDQLVPWIDDNFNTSGDRSGRTIAGLSMGGLGTLMYGARHTDVFSAIGSFSGVTDLTVQHVQDAVNNSMWAFGATVGDTGFLDGNYRVAGSTADRMEAVFGVPTNGDWPARSPLQLASTYNAFDTKLGLYSGQNSSIFENEREFGLMADAFHAELNAEGVDHRYCTGTGTHSWSFWRNDLADFLQYIYGTTPSQCTTNPGWTEQT